MQTETIHPEIAKLAKLAYSAHSGTSFSPEKRAQSILTDYSTLLYSDLQQIAAADEEARKTYAERFIKHLSHWLSAKSRIVSTMIAGTANFPVQRMRKYNEWERSAYDKFDNFRKKALAAIICNLKKAAQPPKIQVETESHHIPFDGGQVVVNYQAERIQILFVGKPDAEIIAKLKKNGFKWSPSHAAWQRFITNATKYAVNHVLGQPIF